MEFQIKTPRFISRKPPCAFDDSVRSEKPGLDKPTCKPRNEDELCKSPTPKHDAAKITRFNGWFRLIAAYVAFLQLVLVVVGWAFYETTVEVREQEERLAIVAKELDRERKKTLEHTLAEAHVNTLLKRFREEAISLNDRLTAEKAETAVANDSLRRLEDKLADQETQLERQRECRREHANAELNAKRLLTQSQREVTELKEHVASEQIKAEAATLAMRRLERAIAEQKRREVLRQQAEQKRRADAASQLFGRATTHFYDGRYDAAIKLLNQAIVTYPDDSRDYYFRGAALARLGRTNDAIRDFQYGGRAEGGRSREVSLALQRIQGQERLLLERYRP